MALHWAGRRAVGQDLDPELLANIDEELAKLPTAEEAEEAAALEFVRLEDLARWEDPAEMFFAAGVDPDEGIRRVVKSLERERARANLWRLLAILFGVGAVAAVIVAIARGK
jgi:hypothetical protein